MSKILPTIEVEYSFIKELFELAGRKCPVSPTRKDIQALIDELKNKISDSKNVHKTDLIPLKNLLPIDIKETEDKQSTQSTSILVIDDLVMVTYQLSILLSKIGYKVTLARTAPDAITLFNTNYYKYVLMDLHLPDREDGISLLQLMSNKIIEEKIDTKIIMMSSLADPDNVVYCLKHGADSFIEKSDDWKREIVNCLNNL